MHILFILLIISLFSRSAPSKRSYGHRLKKREEENEEDEEDEEKNEEEKRERRSEGRHWRTISNQKPKAGS